MKLILTPIFLLLSISIFNLEVCTKLNAVRSTVSIFPKPYSKAFPNPLKGFRASSVKLEDYPTLTRLYVKWNDIENNEHDGVEKIVSYGNLQWKDLPQNNVKVIPRVYLEWPYSHQNALNTRDTVTASWGDTRYVERFWPADIKRGDYTSDGFKKRLLNLVAKMGKAWDNDPRVAYVEMGLIGWWGEQHTPYIDESMQKLLGDAFTKAFKNKLVMVRQARDFVSFPFGSYWDSFGHIEQQNEATMLIACGDKWITSVRGGEVAYDWGDMTLTGKSPDSSLKLKACRDYMIDYIRKVHCNHLGWINNYNSSNDSVAAGAAELQNNLGYNFLLNQFSYTPNVLPGDSLHVNFFVTNIGSSPFYYNWPVEISLLNPATKQPVWKAICNNVDIRLWLPGDNWDAVNKKYTIEPIKNIVTAVFKIPQNIQVGEYIIAVSILDPAGNLPSVRFSIQNYFKGGRHPMGKMGVGIKISNTELNATCFDDLYSDRSLHYVYSNLSE